MFPPKKKPAFGAKPGMPAMPAKKPAPPMDDLESPDPVEGKPMPGPGDDDPLAKPGAGGADDYGAKLMADIESAGKAMGMDAATSRTAAGAFFKAAADCLGGGGNEDAMGGDINESDTENYPA